MFVVSLLLFTFAFADELDFYNDGFLEAGMQIVNPQNLSVAYELRTSRLQTRF